MGVSSGPAGLIDVSDVAEYTGPFVRVRPSRGQAEGRLPAELRELAGAGLPLLVLSFSVSVPAGWLCGRGGQSELRVAAFSAAGPGGSVGEARARLGRVIAGGARTLELMSGEFEARRLCIRSNPNGEPLIRGHGAEIDLGRFITDLSSRVAAVRRLLYPWESDEEGVVGVNLAGQGALVALSPGGRARVIAAGGYRKAFYVRGNNLRVIDVVNGIDKGERGGVLFFLPSPLLVGGRHVYEFFVADGTIDAEVVAELT